jgi:hypothetical protein
MPGGSAAPVPLGSPVPLAERVPLAKRVPLALPVLPLALPVLLRPFLPDKAAWSLSSTGKCPPTAVAGLGFSR